MAREQFRKQPHHDLAVLQHVGDAGGRARIVLEHVEFIVVDADDVDAGDLHVDVVRHFDSDHLRPECGIAEHEIVGDDAGAQDFARAVDSSMNALSALTRWVRPFRAAAIRRRHDARDDVEGDEPFLRVGLAVDREGDADPAKDQLCLAPPIVEHVGRHLGEPTRQLAIGRAHAAVVALHFVEGGRHPSPQQRFTTFSPTPVPNPVPRTRPPLGANDRFGIWNGC